MLGGGVAVNTARINNPIFMASVVVAFVRPFTAFFTGGSFIGSF